MAGLYSEVEPRKTKRSGTVSEVSPALGNPTGSVRLAGSVFRRQYTTLKGNTPLSQLFHLRRLNDPNSLKSFICKDSITEHSFHTAKTARPHEVLQHPRSPPPWAP